MSYAQKVYAKLKDIAEQEYEYETKWYEAAREMLTEIENDANIEDNIHFILPESKGYSVDDCVTYIIYCSSVWNEDFAIQRHVALDQKYEQERGDNDF